MLKWISTPKWVCPLSPWRLLAVWPMSFRIYGTQTAGFEGVGSGCNKARDRHRTGRIPGAWMAGPVQAVLPPGFKDWCLFGAVVSDACGLHAPSSSVTQRLKPAAGAKRVVVLPRMGLIPTAVLWTSQWERFVIMAGGDAGGKTAPCTGPAIHGC